MKHQLDQPRERQQTGWNEMEQSKAQKWQNEGQIQHRKTVVYIDARVCSYNRTEVKIK